MNKTFIMGAINAFITDDENVFAFEGKVSGKVCVGDTILVSDLGVDGAASKEANVVEIAVRAGESFDSRKAIEDTDAIIYVNGGKNIHARLGVVLHEKDAKVVDVRNAYLNVLGNIYVVARDLDIKPEEFDRLTISDLVDIWGCFFRYHGNKFESPQQKLEYGSKLEAVLNKIRDKLLEAETLYAVYSKATGEPFLYSRVRQEMQGVYDYTQPDVMVVTDARYELLRPDFPETAFEFKKLGKEAVKKFFELCINLNGAAGVKVNGDNVRIPAEVLIDVNAANKDANDVKNPDFVCWNLLIGQLGDVNTAEKKLAYHMFSKELEKAILNATFLIPAQKEEEGKFRVAVTENKVSGKPAVMMYSDWTRLRTRYDETWSALTQKVSDVIDTYDVVFNSKNDGRPSMSITKEVFDNLGK